MKRLLLCRHAKSSWKDLSLADKERSLNKRGKKNGPMMGRRLKEMGIVPDCIISSPAKRACKTAAFLARELNILPAEIEVYDPLYEASRVGIVQYVRSFNDALQTVILVGHNPEFTMVANWLGNLQIANIPTCGIVALDFQLRGWNEIEVGTGHLAFFEYPKKL